MILLTVPIESASFFESTTLALPLYGMYRRIGPVDEDVRYSNGTVICSGRCLRPGLVRTAPTCDAVADELHRAARTPASGITLQARPLSADGDAAALGALSFPEEGFSAIL